jgi:DNA-binding NarL/FixJ family response regulator
MDKIKIVIYEDDTSQRQALVGLIKSADDMILGASFSNCQRVEEQIKDIKPDVILMDIDMPLRSGIEGVAAAKQVLPEVNVLMFTFFDDSDKVFKAVCAGAHGYLLKGTSNNQILEAIREVNRGGAPMTPTIARKVLTAFPKNYTPQSNEMDKLSEREKSVLQLLSKGYSYKMVSAELDISVDTTRTHIRRIYQKLHVHSLSEAISKVFLNK